MPMTEDEQEASSFRYIAPRVMRLDSSRVALVDMLQPGTNIQIFESADALWSAIPSSETLGTVYDLLRAQDTLRQPKAKPPGKLTSLNLADLGL